MAHGRLIPAMLLSSGRLVKGRRFRDHEDAGNPVTTARIYNDQMADEIVVLDIDATAQGRGPDLEALAALTQRCFVPVAFGGGIASVETAAAALRAGADKIVINSAAQAKPSFLSELAEQFGCQAVVAAIDVIDTPAGPRVAAERGHKATARKPAEWAAEIAAAGAGEIFLTSVDREGSRAGLDLAMTRMVAEAVSIPVIAHGGVGRLEDFVSAFTEGGASAVAAGRIFQFADNNLIKVRRYMVQSGVELRSA
jgi:imidazole glycerol-phosphate synthase subunit HisF